jgi:hypothetical protein
MIWVIGMFKTFVKYPKEASRQLKEKVDRTAIKIGAIDMIDKT